MHSQMLQVAAWDLPRMVVFSLISSVITGITWWSFLIVVICGWISDR